jgi:hypothetical protein
MIAVNSSAVDALRRQEQERKAREDKMRNALEILAYAFADDEETLTRYPRFVRAVAREGLGRDLPTETEG